MLAKRPLAGVLLVAIGTCALIVGCPLFPPNGPGDNTNDNGVVDADGDGVPDELDVCPGFDDAADADGDGVPDGCDACAGSPDAVDSDGDGVPDGCDLCGGSDDSEDADEDGVPDGCDVCAGSDDLVDRDGDGIADGCDECPGFDDARDGDSDGVPDGCDFDASFAMNDLADVATIEGTGDSADFRDLAVGDRVVISLPALPAAGGADCTCSWVVEPASRGFLDPSGDCTTTFTVGEAGDAVVVGLETCGLVQQGFAQGVEAGFAPAPAAIQPDASPKVERLPGR